MTEDGPSPSLFKVGDRVRLREEPARGGVIVAGPRVTPSGPEYQVFFGPGDEPWFFETALGPIPDQADQPRWETTEELLRDLLLTKLRNPLTDSLYAYRASRTKYEAYQFRPALKFLRGARQGLLIADEVGLGKTIEAAIIYLELKARMDINRVLVLCPHD